MTLYAMQSLHQRAKLDANRIEPPPAPLPDPDVVYDHILGLASLARVLNPDLPQDIRFVRFAPSDESERNTASFRVMFTNDTKALSQGGYRDADARELWEVLGELMPPEMVAAERQNLASSPRFRFAAAEDAAIYSAFNRQRLSLETQAVDDDRVIQVSGAVRPPEMAFLATPTLARWAYLAPQRANEDDLPPAVAGWRRDVQLARRVLAQDFSQCSGSDKEALKVAITRLADRRIGSFEAEHNHGWVGYSLAQGATGWTQFLLGAGASPFASYQSVSPTCWAIARDEPTAISALINAGATPSSLLSSAPAVFQGPEQQELAGRIGPFPQLLAYATGCGATRAMAALLDAGADPANVNGRRASAAHIAALAGDERAIRLLVGRGARLDLEDQTGHLASEYVPAGSDALFDMMEAVRLGEAGAAPAATRAPTIADSRASKGLDAYGEEPSFWDQASSPPRPRVG